MKKEKLTSAQRLYIYKAMLAYIESILQVDEMRFVTATRDNLESENIVSFCTAICEINKKFYESELRSNYHNRIFIEDLSELQKHKPEVGWEMNSLFWYHPYDKNVRIAILKDVIKRMPPKWWKKIINILFKNS